MFDRPRDLRVSLRLAGVAALTLVPVAAGLLPTPGLATSHLQLALLAAVLAGALLAGLAAGFAAAALGFALLLWRAVEPPGADGGGGRGWALDAEAAVNAFLWFALAKLAAALVAALRNRVARLSEARGRAEAEARQRELLLVEMSHRVMNDMQMLVGVLHAEAAQAADPGATDALRAAAGRVRVLGRVHERLSAQRRTGPAAAAANAAVGDSRTFIEGLVADLRAGVDGLRPVSLAVSAESRLLPLAALGNVGLVVNELVTNALKHAFPGGREGAVRVAFRCEGGTCELVVADNGVGVAAALGAGSHSARASGTGRPGAGGGQGGRLLRALAAQLGGRLEVAAGEVGGTVCRLRFPVPAVTAFEAAPDGPGWPAAEQGPAAAGPERPARFQGRGAGGMPGGG